MVGQTQTDGVDTATCPSHHGRPDTNRRGTQPPVPAIMVGHIKTSTLGTGAYVPSGGARYRTYNHWLREQFGERVHKVIANIDAGFTCPNRDGTVTTGGCTYCNNSSFSPTPGHKDLLVAPDWGKTRNEVIDGIRQRLNERDVVQGSRYTPKNPETCNQRGDAENAEF